MMILRSKEKGADGYSTKTWCLYECDVCGHMQRRMQSVPVETMECGGCIISAIRAKGVEAAKKKLMERNAERTAILLRAAPKRCDANGNAVLRREAVEADPSWETVNELIEQNGAMTLEEVGVAFAFSRERARQIEASALRKMRSGFAELGVDMQDILYYIQQKDSGIRMSAGKARFSTPNEPARATTRTSVLTAEKIAAIRNALSTGESVERLASEYDVSITAIRRIA